MEALTESKILFMQLLKSLFLYLDDFISTNILKAIQAQVFSKEIQKDSSHPKKSISSKCFRNLSSTHVSQPFWSRYDLSNAYLKDSPSFDKVFRKRRKSSHRNKYYHHNKWYTKTTNGSVLNSSIQVKSVPTVNASIRNSSVAIAVFEELLTTPPYHT